MCSLTPTPPCASPGARLRLQAVSRKARKNISGCHVGLRQAPRLFITLGLHVCIGNALFVWMVKPNQSISTEIDLRLQSLGTSMQACHLTQTQMGHWALTGPVKVMQTMGTETCRPWLTALLLRLLFNKHVRS